MTDPSNKPVYVRQSGDCTNATEISRWFQSAAKEARESDGCTFFRCSVHPDHSNLALIEGWTKQPKDQGEQRWGLTAARQAKNS